MAGIPHSVHDTVVDQRGLPIAGALVTIRDDDGALVDLAEGNPLITNATGNWTAVMSPGMYHLVISKGDDAISRLLTVCQEGAPFISPFSEVNLPTVILNLLPVTETVTTPVIGIAAITKV